MKVRDFEVVKVRIPFKKVYKTAHAERTHQESVILKVHTDEGIVGLGNVDPLPGYSNETAEEVVKTLHKHLIPVAIDLDPMNISVIVDAMDQAIDGHLSSKALVEMALYDIKGKALHVPVCVLLGGCRMDRIPIIGWIGRGETEQNVEEAIELVAQGFATLKVKIGTGISKDIERIRAIRDAIGDGIPLRVDANEAYSVDDAIQLIKSIEKYGIVYCEQPVLRSDLDGLSQVRKATNLPINSDEGIVVPQDIIRFVNKNATDYIKVKVMKNGGISKTMSMISLAEAFGIRCVLGHGFDLTISALAELHVAAASKNILYPCEMVGPLKMVDDVVTEGIKIHNGFMHIPQKPGLGVMIDDEKLDKYKE